MPKYPLPKHLLSKDKLVGNEVVSAFHFFKTLEAKYWETHEYDHKHPFAQMSHYLANYIGAVYATIDFFNEGEYDAKEVIEEFTTDNFAKGLKEQVRIFSERLEELVPDEGDRKKAQEALIEIKKFQGRLLQKAHTLSIPSMLLQR